MSVRRLAPLVAVIMCFVMAPASAQTDSRPISIRASESAALARLVGQPTMQTPLVRRVVRQSGTNPSAASRRPAWKNHAIAIFGGAGAGVGLIIGNRRADPSNCPAGRSCSTAGIGVAADALLGWGIGSLVGAVIAATK